MIKFQGRSSLKQYMPMKPIKRGTKVWVLGDSSAEKGIGARVVKEEPSWISRGTEDSQTTEEV